MPSDTVARRVKELRKRRGWSARRLAEACWTTDSPQISESVIANIETGRRDEHGRRRRDVTIDELVAFARALDIPLIHLLPVHLDREAMGWTLDFATAKEAMAFADAAVIVARGLSQLIPFTAQNEGNDG
jgi:transcriptional regulator with XRE-family HTH domain